MAKKKTNKIGFDPLAWMKDSAASAPAQGQAGSPPAGAVAPHPAPEKQSGTGTVDFGDALDLASAGVRCRELQAALAGPGPVRLELRRVDTVDTAGVQLLVAFKRAADKAGIRIEWGKLPAGVHEAATALGLVLR